MSRDHRSESTPCVDKSHGFVGADTKAFKYNTVSIAATKRRTTAEIIFKHKNHVLCVGAIRTTM